MYVVRNRGHLKALSSLFQWVGRETVGWDSSCVYIYIYMTYISKKLRSISIHIRPRPCKLVPGQVSLQFIGRLLYFSSTCELYVECRHFIFFMLFSNPLSIIMKRYIRVGELLVATTAYHESAGKGVVQGIYEPTFF